MNVNKIITEYEEKRKQKLQKSQVANSNRFRTAFQMKERRSLGDEKDSRFKFKQPNTELATETTAVLAEKAVIENEL
jgi:hypothetical protein